MGFLSSVTSGIGNFARSAGRNISNVGSNIVNSAQRLGGQVTSTLTRTTQNVLRTGTNIQRTVQSGLNSFGSTARRNNLSSSVNSLPTSSRSSSGLRTSSSYSSSRTSSFSPSSSSRSNLSSSRSSFSPSTSTSRNSFSSSTSSSRTSSRNNNGFGSIINNTTNFLGGLRQTAERGFGQLRNQVGQTISRGLNLSPSQTTQFQNRFNSTINMIGKAQSFLTPAPVRAITAGIDLASNFNKFRTNQTLSTSRPSITSQSSISRPQQARDNIRSFVSGVVNGELSKDNSWANIAGRVTSRLIPGFGPYAAARDILVTTDRLTTPKSGRFEEGVGSFINGAIVGDFNTKNNTWSKIGGQTVVGLIPIAGQVADVRDTIAAIKNVAEGKEGAWTDLGLAVVGWVPGLGDAAKGGARALRQGAKQGLGEVGSRLFRNIDPQAVLRQGQQTFESLVKKANIGDSVNKLKSVVNNPLGLLPPSARRTVNDLNGRFNRALDQLENAVFGPRPQLAPAGVPTTRFNSSSTTPPSNVNRMSTTGGSSSGRSTSRTTRDYDADFTPEANAKARRAGDANNIDPKTLTTERKGWVGYTPSKSSGLGKQVINRMKSELNPHGQPMVREVRPGKLELWQPGGTLKNGTVIRPGYVPVDANVHMGHRTSAAQMAQELGAKGGPKNQEILDKMRKDANNYVLEYGPLNISHGGDGFHYPIASPHFENIP
ncbi:MAG: hypothetical protein JNN15_02755 [Blastocatellia bacterium]|nr:hypothetical protein [Blastocatellia bacterium]